jgi:hypothetical protein
MSANDTLSLIAQEVGLAIEPLANAMQSPMYFVHMMNRLGWDVAGFIEPVRDLAPLINSVSDLLTDDDVDAAQIATLIGRLENAFGAIRALATISSDTLPTTIDVDIFRTEFPQQLLDYLIVDYLLYSHPSIGRLLQLLGVIRLREVLASGKRIAYIRHEVNWSDLARVLKDPFGPFRSAYRWGQSNFDGMTLLHTVEHLWLAWGLSGTMGTLTNAERIYLTQGAVPAAVSSLQEAVVRMRFVYNPYSEPQIEAGLGLEILPETGQDKPGFVLLPYARGTTMIRYPIAQGVVGDIKVAFSLAGGVALHIRPNQPPRVEAGFINGATTGSVDVNAGVTYAGDQGTKRVLIGTRDGSRLEVKSVSLRAGSRVETGSTPAAYIEFAANEAAVVIKPSPNDGFLVTLLPKELTLNFGFLVGLDSARGLYFKGSGGLEITLPLHIDLFGVLKIDSVYLSLQAKSVNSITGIELIAATSVSLKLGPVEANVEQMGMSALLTFPPVAAILGRLRWNWVSNHPKGVASKSMPARSSAAATCSSTTTRISTAACCSSKSAAPSPLRLSR